MLAASLLAAAAKISVLHLLAYIFMLLLSYLVLRSDMPVQVVTYVLPKLLLARHSKAESHHCRIALLTRSEETFESHKLEVMSLESLAFFEHAA